MGLHTLPKPSVEYPNILNFSGMVISFGGKLMPSVGLIFTKFIPKRPGCRPENNENLDGAQSGMAFPDPSRREKVS